MEITVNLTQKNWDQYIKLVPRAALSNSPRIKWMTLLGALIFLGSTLWTALVTYSIWPTLLPLLGGVIFITLYLFDYQKTYKPEVEGIFIGEFKYTISLKKITSSSSKIKGSFSAESIPYIIEDQEHYIICVDKISGLIIPKQQLSASELEKLKTLLYKLDKPFIKP